MAKNWTAYEAAKEIIEGKDKENICEIGSRYPMLTREVAVAGDKILVILKALPKVTARVLETGLKDGVEVETESNHGNLLQRNDCNKHRGNDHANHDHKAAANASLGRLFRRIGMRRFDLAFRTGRVSGENANAQHTDHEHTDQEQCKKLFHRNTPFAFSLILFNFTT